MLSLEIKVLINGKELSIDSVLQAIADRLRSEVREETSATPSRSEGACREPVPASDPPCQAVSVPEAARLLSVSPWTLRRYIALKTIRTIRIGRRVLVPMTTVNEVMQRGIPSGTPVHTSKRAG